MNTGFARIIVQNSFCTQCIDLIKTKMLEVQNVSNITLYPADSLVVFNFAKAHQISEVLNTLTALGYPPKGDCIKTENQKKSLCACTAIALPKNQGVGRNLNN